MTIPAGTKLVDSGGFEICVLCLEKADPPVLFITPIDERAGYVEGSGQICMNVKLCQERRNRKITKQQERS